MIYWDKMGYCRCNLVGSLEHECYYFSIYWESSSQLTNMFQREWNHQPVMEYNDKLKCMVIYLDRMDESPSTCGNIVSLFVQWPRSSNMAGGSRGFKGNTSRGAWWELSQDHGSWADWSLDGTVADYKPTHIFQGYGLVLKCLYTASGVQYTVAEVSHV